MLSGRGVILPYKSVKLQKITRQRHQDLKAIICDVSYSYKDSTAHRPEHSTGNAKHDSMRPRLVQHSVAKAATTQYTRGPCGGGQHHKSCVAAATIAARAAPKGRGRHPRKAHQRWLAPIRSPGATVGRGSPVVDNHAINFVG